MGKLFTDLSSSYIYKLAIINNNTFLEQVSLTGVNAFPQLNEPSSPQENDIYIVDGWGGTFVDNNVVYFINGVWSTFVPAIGYLLNNRSVVNEARYFNGTTWVLAKSSPFTTSGIEDVNPIQAVPVSEHTMFAYGDNSDWNNELVLFGNMGVSVVSKANLTQNVGFNYGTGSSRTFTSTGVELNNSTVGVTGLTTYNETKIQYAYAGYVVSSFTSNENANILTILARRTNNSLQFRLMREGMMHGEIDLGLSNSPEQKVETVALGGQSGNVTNKATLLRVVLGDFSRDSLYSNTTYELQDVDYTVPVSNTRIVASEDGMFRAGKHYTKVVNVATASYDLKPEDSHAIILFDSAGDVTVNVSDPAIRRGFVFRGQNIGAGNIIFDPAIMSGNNTNRLINNGGSSTATSSGYLELRSYAQLTVGSSSVYANLWHVVRN